MFLPRFKLLTSEHATWNIFDVARMALRAVPSGGTVLEIGCEDGKWLGMASAADPSVTWTGIDWKPGKVKRGANVTVTQGDVRTADYAPASFDAVLALSALEHIGLGHYNSDPVDVDGDSLTVANVRRWLNPGGWFYLDVPYTPDGYQVLRGTKCRCYDDAALAERLGPHTVLGYADLFGRWVEKPTRNARDANRPYWYVALRIDV